jgi:hypothetical protein
MDPATLAASALAILTPYVTKAGKDLLDTAGQVAYDHAKKLLNTLKTRWSTDAVASDTLSRFEKKPEVYAAPLQEIVQERLQSDKQLHDEVAQTVKEVGPKLEVFLKLTRGENITAAEIENFTSGEARANVEAAELKDSILTKVKNMG